jgi:hypothetical protein
LIRPTDKPKVEGIIMVEVWLSNSGEDSANDMLAEKIALMRC